ncbi:MAG: flagellar biosynthetic protein FliO [Ignavibacteriae bacterium]|nr:flagellar biosynthetic protein FliO [Ignavibacteriota bacterium]
MEWVVIKTFLALAAVIGLMIAVVYVMKKFVYGNQASGAGIVDMKVIGSMTLQPKRSISVVKVMNTVLVVGVSEEGMQTLAEITDAGVLADVNEKLAAIPAPPRWFSKKNEERSPVSFAEALGLQISKLTAKR